ncbi:MAG: hypothetical protein KJ063_03050 [Anaerolineae bacterium]|nr:hypothetical protein [Anaerolineae bacterium]
MITAVVMVEGQQSTGVVGWVQGARRAAAADLLDQLSQQPGLERIILVSPEPLDLSIPQLHYLASQPGPLHVGEKLAQITAQWGVERLLYFGGGSAPLLADEQIAEVIHQLQNAERLVITNNQFASDWAGVVPTGIIDPWRPRLERDNALGWVLSQEAGLPIVALPSAAATRLDIDTPTDLLTLALHPGTRPHLHQFLNRLPLKYTPLQNALHVLATPASRVIISGRFAPDVWQQLNRATRIWLRVFSEERGMVSSGRQGGGQVHSLVGAYIEAVGMPQFFTLLSQWADAAFIDSRVLLAHFNLQPDDADRFASDLGQVEEIRNPWLRQFTELAANAPIPIILGGHSLLAGDMLAFCDWLAAGNFR